MKKVLLAAIVVSSLTLTSCKGGKPSEETAVVTDSTAVAVDSVATDSTKVETTK